MAHEEQKDLHEQLPDLYQDPRFTDEIVEAFRGEADLAGDRVIIRNYEGTLDVDDTVKHYFAYEDPAGEEKFTTLDHFIWLHLPKERQEELEAVGISAHDLDAGTDPILSPASEAPTGVLNEREATVAMMAGQAGAQEALARLTGRVSRSAPSTGQHEDLEARLPEPTADNFADRIAEKLRDKEETESKSNATGEVIDRDVEAKREHLDKLVGIAAQVAEKMKEKAEVERERQEREGVDEPNPYEPELIVVHRWDVHKKRAWPAKIERSPKIKSSEERDIVKGWLLARTASVIDRNRQTQEVILGEDGKLHVYVRTSMSSSMELLGNPMARQDLQDSFEQELVPPEGKVYLASKSDEAKGFVTIRNGNEYPLKGLKGYSPNAHIFAEPAIIQRGLEDLIVEKELRLES